MRLWITGTVTVLAVTVLILMFVRPFTVYVTDGNRLYIVNTFTGSGKACIGHRCKAFEQLPPSR